MIVVSPKNQCIDESIDKIKLIPIKNEEID